MDQDRDDGAWASAVPSPPGGGAVSRLQTLCADATRALSAVGVGVSVMAADGGYGMAAASDLATERIEELQFTFGEGPCVDAFASRRPVLIADLDDQGARRWPVYTPAVYKAGIRAVFAFPLQVGAAQLGVLDVFRTHAGTLSRAEIGQAVAFSDLAVTTLLDGQDQAHGEHDVDGAIEHGAALWQAQGMVMVMLGVTLAEALVRLRAHAYTTGRRLSEVAADVVAGRLHFDRDHS
ncbi:GAF and ANTAR domain-containing protein [Paractinoplanes rishiriensis]|uniref:GAF domain-containing protein n=1 Tax=Paractinoplanes rishiriensis TaxID=1050105 RepID=A0A919K864_9ACTN|nr:GAF and ANTAR domain-containing protein [Actinoplanes rishiriensis]GIF01834.1 GAF domain-containing protein [Actinoplanes rishiriensis]